MVPNSLQEVSLLVPVTLSVQRERFAKLSKNVLPFCRSVKGACTFRTNLVLQNPINANDDRKFSKNQHLEVVDE